MARLTAHIGGGSAQCLRACGTAQRSTQFRPAIKRSWMVPKRKSRLLPWWYASIALGFVLLAIYRVIIGERPWLIALRVVIALGFAALAAFEFRSGRRGK
jgi:hypothetical protein